MILFFIDTKAAAKKVARSKPGAVVVEATPEMFVEAIKTHKMGVPWLYIGTELGDGVDFQRVRLALALGQYARDGHHWHGEVWNEQRGNSNSHGSASVL